MAGPSPRIIASFVKNLFLYLLIVCGTLLPLNHSEAAGLIGKRYGGFTRETKFTLTVTKRISKRIKGTRVDKNVPVPKGIPHFREGRKVRFTIGRKGRLNGPGFSIDFKTAKPMANIYANSPAGSFSKGEAATVTKIAGNIPTGAILTFYKAGFSGFRPVTNTVSYVLE